MALGFPLSRLQQAFARLTSGFHKKFLTFRSALVRARFDAAGAVACSVVCNCPEHICYQSRNRDAASINNKLRPRFRPPFTLCHRASGPFLAPFALLSQWIQGREVKMTVQCQKRANCACVYRCQIRTYDEKMRGSNGGIDG